MAAELVLGAVALLPAILSLNSKIWKDVGEIRKSNRDAKSRKVLEQLHEELATWGLLLQSISRVETSDGEVLGRAESYCQEYQEALLKMNECLERFRSAATKEDWREMTQAILDLGPLKKSVRHHRKKVQGWILSINTIVVNRIHELFSEASNVQAQKLENIQQRIQGIEALLRKSPRDHQAAQGDGCQMEPVAELVEITDDLLTICSQRMTDSVLSYCSRVGMSDSDEEDLSEAEDGDSPEGSTARYHGSSTTTSQGTQTTLSYPPHSIATFSTLPNSTPTSPTSMFEDEEDDESSWNPESDGESFNEADSDSSFTIDHLDEGMEVMDRTQPEEGDLDHYTASNAALKKLQSSIADEHSQIVAGSFGQATRGGPEVLAMSPAEWSQGVGERFWSGRGYSIGIAFERDWRPFQTDTGLATLSNASKLYHLVRRVSFLTRPPTTIAYHDLRQGLAKGGTGGFFAWNMTESYTYDECGKILDLLCAQSLIRVGEDSSMWESTVFCITVPWKLYRFWTSVRERCGVGYLVDQGLLAEIPVKITGEDGQAWQRLWCPETVQGSGLSREIPAMLHEFSLPRSCGSYMLPRRFIVVVYKTGTTDEWVRSVHASLNMDPSPQIHQLGVDGKFKPPIDSEKTGKS